MSSVRLSIPEKNLRHLLPLARVSVERTRNRSAKKAKKRGKPRARQTETRNGPTATQTAREMGCTRDKPVRHEESYEVAGVRNHGRAG